MGATEEKLKVANLELDNTNLSLKEDLEAMCQDVAKSKQTLSITEVELKEALDAVETLKKSSEEKNSELEQTKSMCDEHKKMDRLREAKIVQLEDENDALKQGVEESLKNFEVLEKELRVKTMAAEKLAQDLETERLGLVEYK